MPYYVRAINRENWPEPEDRAVVHELQADAMNDLKTVANEMSVWYAENEEDIPKAELAYLASMDKWVKVEEAEFVAIDTQLVEEKGIDVKPTECFTYIEQFKDLHRDFYGLTYDSLEKLADIVIQTINQRMDRLLSRPEIRELFSGAIETGLISSDMIEKERHGGLKKYLKSIENELI